MNDGYFMRIAIEEARQGDWPYGAVVVKDQKILAKAFNTTRRDVNVQTPSSILDDFYTAQRQINHLRAA